jgi:hypothetical protein
MNDYLMFCLKVINVNHKMTEMKGGLSKHGKNDTEASVAMYSYKSLLFL